MTARVAVVLVCLLALAGCAGGGQSTTQWTDPAPPPETATRTTTTNDQAPSGAPAAGAEPRRNAARLILVGFPGTEPTPALLRRMRSPGWAGVVFSRGNATSASSANTMIVALRAYAREHDLQTPLVVSDQPGGPYDAIPVGRTYARMDSSPEVAERRSRAAARRLRTAGVDAVFGPPADVGSYSAPTQPLTLADDAATVAELAVANARGLREGGVRPLIGHYPGQGAASSNPSLGPTSVGLSLAELRRRDLAAMQKTFPLAAGIQLSTASFVAFDAATPATMLKETVDLLRAQGYRGPVISGDLAIASDAADEPIGDVAVEAFLAGCDLLWVRGPYDDQIAARRALEAAIRSGRIPARRLDQALVQIQRLRAGTSG